jgi:hypothetical protein
MKSQEQLELFKSGRPLDDGKEYLCGHCYPLYRVEMSRNGHAEPRREALNSSRGLYTDPGRDLFHGPVPREGGRPRVETLKNI